MDGVINGFISEWTYHRMDGRMDDGMDGKEKNRLSRFARSEWEMERWKRHWGWKALEKGDSGSKNWVSDGLFWVPVELYLLPPTRSRNSWEIAWVGVEENGGLMGGRMGGLMGGRMDGKMRGFMSERLEDCDQEISAIVSWLKPMMMMVVVVTMMMITKDVLVIYLFWSNNHHHYYHHHHRRRHLVLNSLFGSIAVHRTMYLCV